MITLTMLFTACVVAWAVSIPLIIVARVLGALVRPLLALLVPVVIVGMVLGAIGDLFDARGLLTFAFFAAALVYFARPARA